jgi:integrase/recombinase XerC
MNTKKFIQYIHNEKNYSAYTAKAYLNDLNAFDNFLRDVYGISSVNEIDSYIVRSWVIHLIDEGKSNVTVNRKLSTLKSYFNFLIKTGEVKKNPVKSIKSLKIPVRLPDFIRKEKLETLFEHHNHNDDFKTLRDLLVVELLYVTGMRLSELINLKESDINFTENTFKVKGKRNKERIIPFSLKERSFIIRYMKIKQRYFTENTPYLIVTNKGEKSYEKLIYRIVTHYLSGLTHTKRSPHILRHTFATHMLNNGADLNTIKELLGHASLSATQVYTHNTIEQLKSIYNHAHPRAHIKKEV